LFCLFVCSFVCLLIFLLVNWFIYLFTYLFTYLFIYLLLLSRSSIFNVAGPAHRRFIKSPVTTSASAPVAADKFIAGALLLYRLLRPLSVPCIL
jgi:hypothetical protein